MKSENTNSCKNPPPPLEWTWENEIRNCLQLWRFMKHNCSQNFGKISLKLLHLVARWWRKAWCLDTRGFILKKIQWHIHTGLWSLVNCWHEVLMRHYIRCSWILMRAAVGLMEWPQPWWWSVYPCDTPTSPFHRERRGFACMQRNYYQKYTMVLKGLSNAIDLNVLQGKA